MWVYAIGVHKNVFSGIFSVYSRVCTRLRVQAREYLLATLREYESHVRACGRVPVFVFVREITNVRKRAGGCDACACVCKRTETKTEK